MTAIKKIWCGFWYCVGFALYTVFHFSWIVMAFFAGYGMWTTLKQLGVF